MNMRNMNILCGTLGILLLVGFACACFNLGVNYEKLKNIGTEYRIELVNQDLVLIQTYDTIYKCHFDEIEETIENDNL